ncbi:MAG: hypothetical protein RLZZ196_770 [Bacteroidota bacterium]|jgi:hypothetical protein
MIKITCNKCKEAKLETDFYFDSKRNTYKGHCKDCHIGYVLESRRSNKNKCTLALCEKSHYALGYCRTHYERHKRGAEIDKVFRGPTDHPRNLRKYGITADEFLVMSSNGCMMCGSTAKEFFVIDHDHACCNEVPYCGDCTRGVVCYSCNINISKYEQNVMHKTNPMKDKVVRYLVNHDIRLKKKGLI